MAEFIMPVDLHNKIMYSAFIKRGFTDEESQAVTRISYLASWHGIKTHNGLKAISLDDNFGSGNRVCPGCVPQATIQKLPSRFPACEKWNANKKMGPSVAFEAMETAIRLADQYGVGIVSVDCAFHYIWGGGYVLDAAKRGYIAYTNCTAALAEVVPFGGTYPTLGTNPHTWGFPTTSAVGFPVVIDWATSTIAKGRVAQLEREGKQLSPGCAVDAHGQETLDPSAVAALLTFGQHKGYGLALVDELVAALIGGSLPTIRSRPQMAPQGEKTTPAFFFQVIHPEALDCGACALGRNQEQNVRAVLEDIRGHGNEKCLLPGEVEYNAAVRSEKAGGLIFTAAEIAAYAKVAADAGVDFDPASLKQV